MTENRPCPQCGLTHSKLGVSIENRVLVRRVHGSKHRLRCAGGPGGAFAFSSRFWDAHAGRDFDQLVIRDIVDGSVYFGSAQVLRTVERKTFSLAFGEQIVIAVDRLERTRTQPRRLAVAD